MVLIDPKYFNISPSPYKVNHKYYSTSVVVWDFTYDNDKVIDI